MKYYYVDFENVHEHGLKGIEQLSKDCHVFVYWHKGAKKPPIYEVEVKITYVYTQNPLKNAVDCKIAESILEQIKKDSDSEYFIVSKDKEYDKLIKEIGSNHNIKRIESIAAYKEKIESVAACKEKYFQQIQTLFNNKLIMHRDMICNIILDSKTKTQVRSELQKRFDNKRASYIYQTIKDFIQNLPEK